MIGLKRLALVFVSLMVVAGCVRDEEALTANESDPIGSPPPAPAALAITAPANATAEATGPQTSVTLGTPTATGGDGNFTFSNDAPVSFALGATSVSWTVTDGSGASASASQTVTVSDTTAPILSKPDDMLVTSTGMRTMIDIGVATATDLVDSSPAISNDAPSTGYPMGETAVIWSATDASGNVSTSMQMITVAAPSSGPLTITAPANISAEATAANSNVAIGNASVAGGQAPLMISNDAPAGGFPLGTTVVRWTVTDATSASVSDTQSVVLADTTAPMLNIPGDVTANQDFNMGPTPVDIGAASATDSVDTAPSVTNDAPTGGFPVGTTTVTWTAADASGNQTTATQNVVVSAFIAQQCSELDVEFASVIYPLMDSTNPVTCSGCHTGSAPLSTPNNFAFPNDPPTTADFERFRTVSNIDFGGESLVIAKARGAASHSGGNRFPDGDNDPDYVTFVDYVQRAQACLPDNTGGGDSVVQKGSGYEQLFKVTSTLGSRPPIESEITAIEAAGTDQMAIDGVLVNVAGSLMNEPEFYERVLELYNDLLLTNRDMDDRGSVDNNFDLDAFQNRDYYEDNFSGGQRSDLREAANYGIARAPVELIRYVIENNRPFTEIMTADYVMVNPYSAVIFDVDAGDPTFPFTSSNNMANHDPDDFRRVNVMRQQDGTTVPLSGILTTHTFLARYPSTNTNVNRKRAAFTFDYFLGIDIEGLAARDGLDLDNVVGSVPTYEDPQCTVCHNVMDPVAGLFTKRDNGGEYDTGNTFLHTRTTNGVPRMVTAGYSMDPADALPSADEDQPLIWLSLRIAADDRFARKTARTVFTGLTGIEPSTPAATAFIEDLKTAFVASNFDFKMLVQDTVLSDFFLARNLGSGATTNDYLDYGAGRLLTPEELDRRVLAVTDGEYRWRGPNTNSGLTGTHYLLYGGIDSDEVIDRTTSPNSMIDGIQERIANQLSCSRVADDLYNDGVLFPHVNETTTPDTGEAAIRDNLVFLHRRLLGEDYATDDAEIDATYQLFIDARALGETAIPNECRGGGGATDTNGTVLPWMAVVTYLIADYRFLYD
ncbi:MAG: HYR domain-containing protein [Pseudomonadota bacterium]